MEIDPPWYQKGLNFKCTECGKCCTGAPGYVWISEEEIEAAAAFMKMDPILFKRKFTRLRDKRYALVERKKDKGCIFLEGKKCSIYPVRPQQCRTYPWWAENLNSEESWKIASEECEGINANAPLVSHQEILIQLKKN